MAAGLGVLQLAPDDFWRMTPRELAAALDGLAGGATSALAPVELQALMGRYPDKR
jgi:uncharacterized phage protein (TIGR02216 family)